mmetsp:Transcript_19067/g.39917  ORF Transcript_19067/g.39917 Transcript_19067/m.39917 type:complete len:209 (+) Transcript_19067:135-761(+)
MPQLRKKRGRAILAIIPRLRRRILRIGIYGRGLSFPPFFDGMLGNGGNNRNNRRIDVTNTININININAGPPPRIPRGVLIPLTPPEDPPILPEEAAEEDRDWEKPSATCSAALRREAPPFRANGVPPSRNSRGRLPRLARRIALPARGFLLPMPFRRRLRIPRQRKGEERPPSSRTISSASRGGNIPPLPLRVRMPHRRRRLPMERR